MFWESWCLLVSLLVLAPVMSSLPMSIAGAGAIAVDAGTVIISLSQYEGCTGLESENVWISEGEQTGLSFNF